MKQIKLLPKLHNIHGQINKMARYTNVRTVLTTSYFPFIIGIQRSKIKEDKRTLQFGSSEIIVSLNRLRRTLGIRL